MHIANYGLLPGASLTCKEDLDAKDVNKQLVLCEYLERLWYSTNSNIENPQHS